MARKALINKAKGHHKYASRAYSRCQRCGRVHATMSKFGLCRLCFRELALKGQIPGVKKASW